MPGVRCTRGVQKARQSHRFTGLNRHSLRDGFTVSFVLSPVTGFLATVVSVMRKHHRRLDASIGASGPHDFAVRKSRGSSTRATRVHRSPRPTLMTMANVPLAGTG